MEKEIQEAITLLESQGYEIIPPQSISVINEEFEKWWKMYGKCVGKQKCLKKWMHMTKKDRAACMAATPRYVASITQKVYQNTLLLILIPVLGRMKYILSMTKYSNNSSEQSLISQEQQQRSLTLINFEEWVETNYPLISNRKEPVYSLTSALEDTNTLASLDNDYGEGFALKWVKAQLLDTFRLLGAGSSVNSLQIVFMARRIRSIYYYLSPSELTYFLESLVGGGYGKIYVGNTINPQNFMEALMKFDSERATKLSQIANETNKERKKNVKADIDTVNAICNKIRKELTIKLMGSKAGNEYKSFNVNKSNNEN